MAGLQLKVTPAGRAAIVNLPNTGTNAVLISHIGITATAFDPATNPSTLPGELKRLTTFAGQVVADDTIHVTLRDDSADTYSMRGFALYLADGTLFALYGQAAVILEKSPAAMLLLSADVKFADIAATSIEFGDASFVNPAATTEVEGVTRYATNPEAVTGAAVNRSITAAALKWVLDQRFGAGAPSAFVKTLLGLTTAALIRAALEIKSAAMSEASDFAAAGHGHSIAGITGLQTALDGKQPAGSYAAASHGHTIAQVTGLQTALDGKQPAGSYAAASHSHDASHIATGVLSVDRVPDLAQSKVTGLAVALASKAPTNAPQFTGGTSLTGTHKIHDPGDGSVVLELGAGYSSATDKHAFIANRNPAGFIELFALNGGSRLRVQGTGVTWNDNLIWHVGNFNPTTKVNLSADSVGHIRLTGNGNAYYITDRTSSRDWATYASGDKFIVWGGSGDVAWFGPSGYLHLLDYLRAPTINTATISPLTNEGFQFTWNVVGSGNGRNEYINNRGGGDGGHFFYTRTNTGAGLTVLAAITPSGQVQAIGGFRNTSSRLTKNIEGPIPYGLETLRKLTPVVGSYKREYFDDGGKRRLFLIAENVAKHMPEPVDVEGVEFGDDKVPNLDYMQIVPVLVNGVNQLAAIVDSLRDEVAALRQGRA